MRLVRLKNVSPGMKTAKEVLDAAGKVLMGVGAELTERTLDLIARRGVESIWVEAEGEGVTPQDFERMKAELSKELDAIFAGRLDDEVMAYIHEAVKKHLARKMEK